jgi:AcrR family transcriptional regulator
MSEKKLPVKEKILETATGLFHGQGINKTGIDQIIRESGVAKASFYYSYPSKESLIVSYLEKHHRDFVLHVANRDDVWAPFEGLENIVKAGPFMGCPFANALAELPNSRAIANAVGAYRESVLEFFEKAVQDDSLAKELMIIYDGAFLACKLQEPATILPIVKSMVESVRK